MEKSVCVLIVTYNRKNCLVKLLPALIAQTYPIKKILIVDNASTDNTPECLIEYGYIQSYQESVVKESCFEGKQILFFRNHENIGGSGGFHIGMKIASDENCDYIWAMDDDVLPDENCLEMLMKEVNEKTKIAIPCRTDNRYKDYAVVGVNMSNPFLYNVGLRKRMIPSDKIDGNSVSVVDMVFEGPLIAVSLVKEIGLPRGDFFIIFDDSEYAYRARKVTEIRYVKNALLHRQIIPDKVRRQLMGWKEYYGYRNQYWFDRTYGENIFVKILRPILNHLDLCIRAIIKRKWSNLRVLRKAYHDGTRRVLGKTVIPGERI